MCNNVVIESCSKELECRRLLMQSIDNALKKGDEVFEKLLQKTKDDTALSYKKFKKGLNKIDHENLKK